MNILINSDCCFAGFASTTTLYLSKSDTKYGSVGAYVENFFPSAVIPVRLGPSISTLEILPVLTCAINSE